MNRLKIILLMASFVLAMVLMASCLDSGLSAFTGKWIPEDGSKSLELFKDGTGISDDILISWKVIENNRFVITTFSQAYVYDYEISGKKLALTDDKGKSKIYVKPQEWKIEGKVLTDKRDGKKYKTVVIGTRTWMAENLNYAIEGSKCCDNEPTDCDKYGRLYNWNTAMKICPSGWHLPSKEEWQTLIAFTGGDKIAGKKLKAKNGWNDYQGMSGNGTDDYGFSALPGGGYGDGYLSDIDYHGYWWSASEDGNDYAYRRDMFHSGEDSDFWYSSKSSLFSVRCVQNYKDDKLMRAEHYKEKKQGGKLKPLKPYDEIQGFFLSDQRDDKTYTTVKIGLQTWMAENLNYNASGSRCYDNDPANCEKYGRLYNWYTALESCPFGWHLPDRKEWDMLGDAVGGSSVAGTKLKAVNGWNNNGNGTDEFGFSALPGGNGNSAGNFNYAGHFGGWWSASEISKNRAYHRYMNNDEGTLWDDYDKSYLFSVRCLLD